ncbi:hypothetical protein D9758_006719 [Tetrapyrgos nigripes]|uniref:Uncharacterized protein n=1 Tax=Tetrapyrgos nigripes TaxID=182062 RepID=A0A8H5LQP4_9AGAR|nr:hypothetical protein D9758_006719 [Tetrapyrgos nigripes]
MSSTPATQLKFVATSAVFDLDGTLTDSTAEVAVTSSSYNSNVATPALTPNDSPASSRRSSISSISSVSSRPRRPSFATELQKSLFELSLKDRAEARIAESTPVRRRPGARVLLESLPTEKYAVLSFGSLDYVHDCMFRAGLPCPKYTVTAEDSIAEVGVFSLAAQRMDFATPGRCAVFVNSPEGIREAIAEGAGTVIGVCGTYSREQLEQEQLHYVVDNLEAVRCTVLQSGELEFHVWPPKRVPVPESVPEKKPPVKTKMLPKLRTRDMWEDMLRSRTLSPLSPSPLPRRQSAFIDSLPEWLRNADVWDEE